MQVEGLDTTVVDYINKLENQIHKLKADVIEYQNKYLYTKEQLDLLLYKRYMRSAENIPEDEKQQLLFTSEAESEEIPEKDESEERAEVKSYSRKKRGRKPIDPGIRREEKIIDISESEKVCECGAKLTRIGEETAA